MLFMMTEYRDDENGEFTSFDLVLNDQYVVKMVPSEDDDFYLVYMVGQTEPIYIDYQDGLHMISGKKRDHRFVTILKD